MASSPLHDKVVLITGGTGSFGKALIRLACAEHEPRKIIVFSRDELKQWEMRESDPLFRDERIRYFLGDVRDKDRLLRAFREVDLVVHAAALKQVPAAEYNPSEFIKTNIHGAMNVVDAALDRCVDRVIALSTDKAANPVNLYGASKLCSDKLFVHGNAYTGSQGQPKFAVVRYGNVLGSRGSIIPAWARMVGEGATELPVTDERMTRFWITLEDAARFVVDCFGRMLGGEIFVPKIPSMGIADLARAMAPHCSLRRIGIRPGEKLHELLIGEEDARHTVEFRSHFAIAPENLIGGGCASVADLVANGGRTLPDPFRYSSDQNPEWLGVEALRDLVARLGYLHAPQPEGAAC